MPIKNVTNKGLSFPKIGRIKKGEMQPTANGQSTKPVDLDYFKVEFEPGCEDAAAKFAAAYPDEKPTSINIRLPFNDIELMWDAFLEAYTAARLIARSDGKPEDGGMVLYRCDTKTGEAIVFNGINAETGKQEPHPKDNIAGYDYKGKPIEYAPIGRLKVIIPELEEAAYMLMTTGSWHDIVNISQQLAGLKELNNGTIKGVPLQLIRSDQEVMAPINGKKTRVTKSLISIKADPDWVAARMAEDKMQAFPQLIVSQLLEDGVIGDDDPYREELPKLTPPSEWGQDSQSPATQVSTAPEVQNAVETPETAPSGESTRDPHDPETLKVGLQVQIKKYDSLLEKDPGKYQISVQHDGPIVASVIDEYIGGLQKDSLSRYAIFTYLLGEGKGSTKTWTAQEIGAVKNVWLKITQYGEKLGPVEEEELRQLWNFVQTQQGQSGMFD